MRLFSLLRQERIPDAALIIIFLTFGLAATSSATVINIPADYPAIQQGIDASSDGDTVLVQPGTYYENVEFNGHNIVLASLFIIAGDTSYINNTILNGQRLASVVTIANGETNAATLTGFTIYNGYSTMYGGHGGGVYCFNSDPEILNNIIINCEAYHTGGGIYCGGSEAAIANNYIADNIAGGGGGIAFSASWGGLIEGNTIENNTAYEIGGGIYCDYSNPVIIDNSVNENYSYISGGAGIGCYGASPVIKNNSITMNTAEIYEFGHGGGGVQCENNSAPILIGNQIHNNDAVVGLENGSGGGLCVLNSVITLLNNIISYNSAFVGDGLYLNYSDGTVINNSITHNSNAIYCAWDVNLQIVNSIIYNNYSSIHAFDSSLISISFSDIQGSWSGPGNIDTNPYIYNVTGQLMSIQCGFNIDSPCIDAGDPNILDSLLDCSWGLGGPRSDIGAYGGGDSLITSIFENLPSIPDNFMLLQNYPNPFNAQTTIRFVLPNPGEVQLTVYGLLGRRIEILIDEYREAGVHTVTFDASALSSGVYFYRLRAGDVVETKRMVLLK